MSLISEIDEIVQDKLDSIREDIAVLKEKINNIQLQKGDIGERGEKGDLGLKGERGPKGERGEKGESGKNGLIGITGQNGVDGRDGQNGKNGEPGKDGVIPTKEEFKKLIKSLMPQTQFGQSRFFGGTPKIKFIENETPSGNINGSNREFILTRVPETDSLKVFLNGARQRINDDYTLLFKTITFTVAPSTSSALLCDYRYF